MKTELRHDEEMLAQEMANLGSAGGHLYVTDRRLIFEPHGLNFRRGATEIPLDDIEDVRPCNTLWLVPNGLEVRLRGGKRRRFVVWNRQALMELIYYQLNSPRPGGGERRPPPPARPGDPGVQPGPSVEGTRRPKES
jgi:hypothetical protein